jgi:uncharacterized protein
VHIIIDDLKPEPLQVTHTFGMGDLKFRHEDAILVEPVTADFVLTHIGRDLRLVGKINTTVCYTCSRCVGEFSKALSAGFDLQYLPQPKSTGTEEIELRYEDMEVGFYDGVSLDVDLVVLEQIELALPMKFVCREDCRGLCPICGADLNQAACRCAEREPDSRMAALLDFKKRTK